MHTRRGRPCFAHRISGATRIYTIFSILVGTSLIAGTLVLIVDILSRRARLLLPFDPSPGILGPLSPLAKFMLVCWIFWFAVGVTWSMIMEDWTFPEACYFTMTLFSTAGMVAVSNTDTQLWICTIFIIIGVPLNAATWGVVMSCYFDSYLQAKEKEEKGESENDALKMEDWETYLVNELTGANLVTDATIAALKEKFKKR